MLDAAHHCAAMQVLRLLPTGTTANEARHSAMRSETKQLPECYRSTKDLQLRCWALRRNIAHNIAAYTPTLSERPSMDLGAMAVCRMQITGPQWTAMLAKQNEHNTNTHQINKHIVAIAGPHLLGSGPHPVDPFT